MSEGDFFAGADKDLVKNIMPVLNYKNYEVSSNEFRMDTGNMNVDKVGMIRQINKRNIVNKNMKIFNGTGYMDV